MLHEIQCNLMFKIKLASNFSHGSCTITTCKVYHLLLKSKLQEKKENHLKVSTLKTIQYKSKSPLSFVDLLKSFFTGISELKSRLTVECKP